MVPDGRGLVRVRSILASMYCSWYWFNADAPQASRKTAQTAGTHRWISVMGARKYPVAAEAAAKMETLASAEGEICFKDDIDDDPNPDKWNQNAETVQIS
jgi:hypothetical protein